MTHLAAGTSLGLLLAASLLQVQSWSIPILRFSAGLGSQEANLASPPDRGTLAVLRRDGILVPFAAFKGTEWSMPWPADRRGREVPIGLDDVPDSWWGGKPPTGWHVRLASGANRPIAPQSLKQFPVFCQMRLGIGTDYRSSEPLPSGPVAPFPKDGLAVTSGVDLLPIEIVAHASPEASQLALTLAREFQDVEDRTIANVQTGSGWRHPFKKAEREKLPVRIEAWYRAPIEEPGSTASYIEAVRAYPPREGDAGCGLETLFSGWIVHDERQAKPRAELSAKITYCDRVGGMYMLPFGRIRLNDRHFWVFQFSGYEEEWYEVVRILPRSVKFEAEFFAGSRRGCVTRRRE
jgi:hypothetical protein